jgi:hypothetical protein
LSDFFLLFKLVSGHSGATPTYMFPFSRRGLLKSFDSHFSSERIFSHFSGESQFDIAISLLCYFFKPYLGTGDE